MFMNLEYLKELCSTAYLLFTCITSFVETSSCCMTVPRFAQNLHQTNNKFMWLGSVIGVVDQGTKSVEATSAIC